LEKKDRAKLLEEIESDISSLKGTDDVLHEVLRKLEAQAVHLRYQQTLPS